ncbi:MAG: E3 binding domain-containing protein, partial [Candidatus Latescibacteria bacterium]|nr:E3 binding domain-containing protein [Candidatus Latescibacterota bacterium]
MPVTIVVPQLGESVVEGTIGKWLKKVGDPIAKDEPVVEIITDKINIELPAPSAGTLGRITIAEGVVAQVGQELGVILAPGESLAPGAAPQAAAPAPPAASSHAAPPSASGARVLTGAPPAGTPARAGAAVPSATAIAEPASTDGQRISPAVRKLAKEHDLDLSSIRGTGMGGRVTREDVLSYIESGKGAVAAPVGPIPVPSFGGPQAREEEVLPLTNVRRKIAENMVRSRHTVAHCATWDDVDMTALVELRARLKEKVK